MDPLDDIFAAMRVQSALYARLEAGAPWGLSLASGQSARFGMVVRGSCLLSAEGLEQPLALTAGDCYVLARGTPYVLRSEPGVPAISCSQVRDKVGGVVELGGDGIRATIVCGWFIFDELSARPLIDLIPPVLHVRMDQVRAQALQATLQLLAMETGEPGLGSSLVISRLADILFVQAIRAHAADGEHGTGWLAALADKKIGPALRAMHANVAAPWSVDTLASKAMLSRSAFALRFKERVGESPLEYLTRWRMFKAGCMLRQGEDALVDIAERVGYESESAFNKAFKRAIGQSPGAYRRSARAALPGIDSKKHSGQLAETRPA